MKTGEHAYAAIIAERDRESRQSVSLKVAVREPPGFATVEKTPALRARWQISTMTLLKDVSPWSE